MFLSSCLLLLPMISATELKIQIDNYVVKIENDYRNTLKSIEIIGDPSEKLNLSGLSLHRINNTAFDAVSHIKILDLSNNSLSVLLKRTFVKLTNLEEFYLSHNDISRLKNPFASLSNLKILDLSNTPIKNLSSGDFFGLTESCVIFLEGDAIFAMSTELFQNKSEAVNVSRPNDSQDSAKSHVYTGPAERIKICAHGNKLISAEPYTKGERLASGCKIDRLASDELLSLENWDVTEFQKGWYKLKDSSISNLYLQSMIIHHWTSEMFNDLPENIRSVALGANHIVRLEKGIIENYHLRVMYFNLNFINEIEDDAFVNTNLTLLDFTENHLVDTKFAATLPATLTEIRLIDNKITEVSPESFSKLNKLEILKFRNNFITEIHRDSFRGLSSLKYLSLEENRLKKIGGFYFKDMKALNILRLNSNKIAELESGAFADLKSIKKITLGKNRLSNLTRDSLINLPDSLEILQLQYNRIENLKAGTFVNSPKYKLFLNNNNISNIEDGSFNLPHLQNLVLTKNFVSVIDSGKFQGFRNLQSLWLDGNKIKKIEKGTFKNLRSLCKLFMSSNPIKRLENGTLHGLLQEEGCYVELKNVSIEMIHGGVFGRSGDSSFDRLSESPNY